MLGFNDGRYFDFTKSDFIRGGRLDAQRFAKMHKLVAEEFSEGCPALNDLLLSLWEQKIYTVACCKGHKDPNEIKSKATENNVPYLTFISGNIPHQDLEKLISRIREIYRDDVLIKCIDNNYNRNEMLISFEFVGATKDWDNIDKTRESFFKTLQKEMEFIKTRAFEDDEDYKMKVVMSLMGDQPFKINFSKAFGYSEKITLRALTADKYCPIFVSVPVDCLQKYFPDEVEEYKQSKHVEFEYSPQLENGQEV